MAARKAGLGRGLDALIPAERPGGFARLRIDRIGPNPRQPRTHFSDETLTELAASIREVGVLQPVIVRPAEEEGHYVLVAGERRWRAADMAGLTEIPAMIREDAEPGTSLVEALIENLQREDLSALEEAAAFQQLLADFGRTHEQVATHVGRSRSAVTNSLRLLQLPAVIQGMLERGALAVGAARALVGLEDEAYAIHVAQQAVEEGWSVRQVEDAVRSRQGVKPVARTLAAMSPPRPAAIVELEQRLSDHLGSKVKITTSRRGGRLTVRFSDLDDLERIYRQFFGS